MGLADEVLRGNRRALARLATHIENDDPTGRAGLEKIYPSTGRAQIVGITGPPGAGKSTLLNALISTFRARDLTVAVVAVDPTSPLSGGATLGDRIRMRDQHADSGVFIRSMASRGRSGGLAPATAGMVHLMDAGGFDVVIVETVGVGQEEIAISHLVETLVLVQTPGAGDTVQLLKAGLLEFADIFAVNKSDLPGAADLLRGLRGMLELGTAGEDRWSPAIVRCSAHTGEGVLDLADQIVAHRTFLDQSGQRMVRRRAIAEAEVVATFTAVLQRRIQNQSSSRVEAMSTVINEVASRALTPYAAVEHLLRHWDGGDSRSAIS